MAGELRIPAATGGTVYAHILNTSSRRWNGSSFEAYASGNYPNYRITMTEQGSSGLYAGDFPIGITDSGEYGIIYYLQDGGSAAEGDPVVGSGTVDWDGSGIADDEDSAAGEVSGANWLTYVLRDFKRTDKNDEVFDKTNAAIAEIRRTIATARDEHETSTTDTISSLGDYRLDLESDHGLFVSEIFIRDEDDGRTLFPISKFRYDMLYGRWGTASRFRDTPQHYCIFGGQILLGPVPDSTDYTYVVSYSRGNLTPVTANSVAIPFTTEDYKEILLHGVLWRLFKSVENDDQAGQYLALWEKGLIQIRNRELLNKPVVRHVAYNDF